MSSYNTLKGPGEAVIIEKKSKFIAQARPAAAEEQCQGFLAEIRKKYWDASHHVFAYVLEDTRRFSDDGEPQGSSGPPVLETLTSAGIRNAIVVVTRYFGGTLLGRPGLVRAYSRAARAGLEAAGIIEKKLCRAYRAEIDYGLWDKVRRIAAEYISAAEYGERITAEFLVELSAASAFETMVRNATGGAARLLITGEDYY